MLHGPAALGLSSYMTGCLNRDFQRPGEPLVRLSLGLQTQVMVQHMGVCLVMLPTMRNYMFEEREGRGGVTDRQTLIDRQKLASFLQQ